MVRIYETFYKKIYDMYDNIYGTVKYIVFWELMHCRLMEIDKNF